MDDHVRIGAPHGSPNRRAVKAVYNQRLTAKLPDHAGLFFSSRRAENLMPGGKQPRNQILPYGPGGAGYENSHAHMLHVHLELMFAPRPCLDPH
jgi:hypothetical protein